MSFTEAIRIQRATVLDTDSVLECLRLAFAPYQSAYILPAYQDTVLTRESFRRRLDQMIVLVAVDQGERVLGTIAYTASAEREGHLRGMAVRPEFQGSGIADQLLEFAEAELVKENCSRISLDTTEPLQRAISLYKRHGFRRSGKVQDFFGMPLIEYFKLIS